MHAAAAANISALFAVLLRLILVVKATMKTEIMTTFAVGFLAKFNPMMGPTRKTPATTMVAKLTATAIDRSLKRAK